MKKFLFFICFSIILFVGVFNNEASASTFSNPEWELDLSSKPLLELGSTPLLESDYKPIIDQFNLVKKNGYLYIYDNFNFEIIIIDDKSGKIVNKIKTGNDIRWIVTEKGVYTINYSSGAKKLDMYSKTGAKVWNYNFKENADNYVGVESIENGNILVYMQHKDKYHYSIYLFNSNGKIIKKEEVDGHIFRKAFNGYLSILSKEGKVLVYDDKLNLKFANLNDPVNYGQYLGITKDEVLYFTSSTTKDTTIYARNIKGKLLWTKNINGQPGRDSFFEGHSITGQSYNNSYLTNIGNTLYLFNSKGLVAKNTFTGFTKDDFLRRFQFGEDRTIMTKEQNKLIITKMEDLSRILEIPIDNKDLTYLYAGNGIIYTYDNQARSKGVLGKFDINKK